MKPSLAIALIAVLLLFIALSSWWLAVSEKSPAPQGREPVAADAKAEDDAEMIAMRDQMGKQSLEQNCQVCHEMRMITSQRLTPAQWKAEVDKMIDWGAVITDGERELIIEHLARNYPDAAPPSPVELTALASLDSPEISIGVNETTIEGDPVEGKQLYMTLCAVCHGPTAMGGDLGPSLANRAVIGHAETYDQIVQKGLRRMPPFESVLKPQQQRDILVWLRGLPRDAVAQAGQ